MRERNEERHLQTKTLDYRTLKFLLADTDFIPTAPAVAKNLLLPLVQCCQNVSEERSLFYLQYVICVFFCVGDVNWCA